MQGQPGFEHCLRYVNSESFRPSFVPCFGDEPQCRLTITFSRQSGCGAREDAGHLAEFLQTHTSSTPSWAVFDQDLVDKVLEDHNLPMRLARFMVEDGGVEFLDALDELLGIHPSFWSLVQQTSQTISRLAERGNAILIGRGAHVVTSGRDRVFHVRLVSSLAKRVEYVQDTRRIGKDEALAAIRREDRGRSRYLKKYFGRDIDDPLSYHLVVNTEFVSHEKAARLIGEAALENFRATPPLA
jgi:cytidylate kinase